MFVIFLIISSSLFAQDFTFQGLPWGSSREQIIDKLGSPDDLSPASVNINNANIFSYATSLLGYLSRLNIFINENGMYGVHYNIGHIQRLDSSQLKMAHIIILGSLFERYGTYHEIIISDTAVRNNEDQYFVWHFNDFHIGLFVGVDDNYALGSSDVLYLSYMPTSMWNQFEETIKTENMRRFPNMDF